MQQAVVLIGEERFEADETQPFVFGRDDSDGAVGLNTNDMGVSGIAGSIEWSWGLWWVVNLSAKRRLLVETQVGIAPTVLERGHRHAVVVPRLRVLVPGALFTYAIEMRVSEDYARRLQHATAEGTGTLVPGADVGLSDKDVTALAAVFAGYLEPWPHRREQPNGYTAAAKLAGPDWTATTVRKRIERIRERFQDVGLFFEGDRARDELAAHLISNGMITGDDLRRLAGRAARREEGSR